MKIKVFSIKTKFVIIALLISMISFGVAAYVSNRWVLEDFEKDYLDKATLIRRHLLHDLKEGMIFKPHDGIVRSLNFFRKYDEVEELRVFDPEGKEVFARTEGSPDGRVAEALRTGTPMHFQKEMNNRNVTTYIFPMENGPECQNCHNGNETFRGAVLLSLSQEEKEKSISNHRRRFITLYGLIAVVIGGMTLVAVDRLLVRRLKPIQSGAEAIERGDFRTRVPATSNDEIGDLTRNVNQMAQKLESFFRELEDKNRQLTEQFRVISRSQKEWQETFDCITDPVAVIDRHHRLVRANRAFQEKFKEDLPRVEDEPICKKWSESFGANLLPRDSGLVPLQDRRPMTQEIHHQRTGRIFEASLFPYGAAEEDFADSVVIFKDVTQKKEDEVRLIFNERLAALGQMASGIAHEINTPLATIAACNEGLLNRMEKENIGSLLFRSYLKIIEEEIERCKKITNGMLSFVRRSDREKRETDINEIVDKTMDLVGFQGRLKEMEVSSRLQREIPKVLCNDGELMQVCLSIVLNALDAMEDKGTLTLETGEKREEKRGSVFIRISDTGPGIPSDLTGKIFDPFFTTKSGRGGTGLGLSIANKIVRDHGGRIVVTSIEGKGATFEVVLPAV